MGAGPGIAIFLALSLALAGRGEAARSLSDEQWLSDLAQLDSAIREIHFKPFHVLPETEFAAAVDGLTSRVPGLSDQQIIVEMVKLVARLRDGHTRLHIPRQYPELALRSELGHSGTPPPRVEALKFRQSSVRFGLYADGLFVVAAVPELRDLIGHRVVRMDQTPVEDALQLVEQVSFFENAGRARLMAPDRLALPELTAIVGVTQSPDRVELTTQDAQGRTATTALDTLDAPGTTFTSGLPANPPLWQRRPDAYRWYELLADRNAIYVQINEFEENPVSPYGDFVAEILAAARGAGVQRFVIDLRRNSGGIGAWVTPFVTGLAPSEFNAYGRLFILMGRETFSAAEHFLHRFEAYTYATFVGEPSGAKPSHFGDGRRVVLEHSGLTLRVSTIYWHSWLANDFREAINPHVAAALTSADYLQGRDPALEAALSYQAPAGLAAQIEEQFRAGNNQNALLHYQRYMADATIRDHAQVVPELLAMADRLVDDGLVRPGYFIYLLTDRSYPGREDVKAGLDKIRPLME